MNWIRGLSRENPKNLLELADVDISKWQTDGQQAELAAIMRNPILRMALRIVAESMPIPMPSQGSRESDIIFAAGITAGYAHCLENIRKLAAVDITRETEATFDKHN